MTPQAVLDYAIKAGYEAVCITNHLWDENIPGATEFYRPQNISHIYKALPLPPSGNVRVAFGCETEYCGGKKLGLSPESFHLFDFIVIPVNHFHMTGFTRPEDCNTAEKIAELFIRRLEELICLELPWEKVGIAHLTAGLTFPDSGDELYRVFRLMPEKRLSAVFRFLGKHGAGIELNAGCFSQGWTAHKEDILRIYHIAKNEGCRFYCASDAHHYEELYSVYQNLSEPVELLDLDDSHRYIIS